MIGDISNFRYTYNELQAIMRLLVIHSILTLLFSCSTSSERKEQESVQEPMVEPLTEVIQPDFTIRDADTIRLLNTNGKTYQLKIDSIDSTPIQEFLNNSNIYPTAKQLYNGQFQLSDNKETFKLLVTTYDCPDELMSFYFHLFNYIATVSDGALSEVFGQEVLHLIELRTEFFFNYFENTQEGDLFYLYANLCAFELLMYDENSLEQVDNFEKMIFENCPNCKPELVKDFSREMRLFIKQNID